MLNGAEHDIVAPGPDCDAPGLPHTIHNCSAGEIPVAMAYLAIFLVVIIKRLTAQVSAEAITISKKRLLLNRLFFDRDIADRTTWVHRKPISKLEKLDD